MLEKLFETDADLIGFALTSWANKIETGDSNLSRMDIQAMASSLSPRQMFSYTKNLTDDQIDLVKRIRKLAKDQF